MEYQDSSINEIFLCDMNIANVKGFTDALCGAFGQSNVALQDDLSIGTSGQDIFSAEMGAIPKNISRSKAGNTIIIIIIYVFFLY